MFFGLFLAKPGILFLRRLTPNCSISIFNGEIPHPFSVGSNADLRGIELGYLFVGPLPVKKLDQIPEVGRQSAVLMRVRYEDSDNWLTILRVLTSDKPRVSLGNALLSRKPLRNLRQCDVESLDNVHKSLAAD